ncbi:MAG: hypothetical protein NVSMB64_01880 [Candidatus Velthaea sp.]
MRPIRTLIYAVLLFALTPVGAIAQVVATSTVSGTVIDAGTGLGLSGAIIVVLDTKRERATTDGAGRFTIAGITPGLVRVEITKSGYQITDSDEFTALAGAGATLTLSLQRSATTANGPRIIGRTSVRASESLQKTSVVYKDVSANAIEHEGYYRVGDYLRTLPGINANGGSETPTPGDDLYLDVRGVGPQDTITLIDGHPIAYGHERGSNLGYNYDLPPTFALRSVQVTYGSGGSDLVGISAIGGVIDMRLLEPTARLQSSFSQSYGTYGNLVSTFNATGPANKNLSFAIAGGVQSRNGFFRHYNLYNPTAAFDASAPIASPDHQSGSYPVDSTVVSRGALIKLKYAFGKPENQSYLTVHGLFQHYWDDKTGNGDDDYQPYNTELAVGNALLAGPPAPPKGVTCAAGTFAVYNANNAPNGFSPNGNPNGGSTCQTPQQYATNYSGYAGTGATWQAFSVQDYGIKFESPLGKTRLTIDAFSNNYTQTYDRTFQLPFNAVPGDNASWQNPGVTSTGVTVNDAVEGKNNDVGAGYAFYNYSYSYNNGSNAGIAYLPSPTVNESAILLRDTYHPEKSKLVAYFNGAFKNSSITHTAYFDPRLSLVFSASRSDVLRLAGGKTTSQPFATFVYTPLSTISQAGLVGNTTCGSLNSIGTGGNPNLLPEKATDEELSYGHRFGGDSQIQATFYNTNVNNKIYRELTPVGAFSPAFLGDLTPFTNYVSSICPGDPRAQLGIGVSQNVGHEISRGLDLAGRARVNRRFYLDYDYSVESAFIRSLPDSVLANNVTTVPSLQLPGVPVHKNNIAADYTLGGGVELRLTRYYVGINNPKNAPAYNYSNFQISAPAGKFGSVNLAVNNAFNQFADNRGRIGNGVRLPVNSFATNFAPLVGQDATELYGLPYRSFLVTYTARLR